MGYDIISAEREFELLLNTPARPAIGKPSRKMAGTELAPVINKHPETFNERQDRVHRLKRAGYLVPVNESIEFMDLSDYDDGSYQSEQDAYATFDAINWGA